MLRLALPPVDPPESLKTRVESTLQELTDAAVDELDSWGMGAMRGPRNWVRPAAARGGGPGRRGRRRRARRHGARRPARRGRAQEARGGLERPAGPPAPHGQGG